MKGRMSSWKSIHIIEKKRLSNIWMLRKYLTYTWANISAFFPSYIHIFIEISEHFNCSKDTQVIFFDCSLIIRLHANKIWQSIIIKWFFTNTRFKYVISVFSHQYEIAGANGFRLRSEWKLINLNSAGEDGVAMNNGWVCGDGQMRVYMSYQC